MFEIIRDARDPASNEGLGALPEWDLTDLYASEDAPELARDLDWLGAECATFDRMRAEASCFHAETSTAVFRFGRDRRVRRAASRRGSCPGGT